MGFAANIDGRIVTDRNAACIPVLDRGFLYGDSIYEVLRTYSGGLFAVGEHLDRLWRSARAVGLVLPFGREGLREEIDRTVSAAGNAETYVRIVVTRGAGEIGLDPAFADAPRMVIIAKELTLPVAWTSGNGIAVRVVEVRRNLKNALDPGVKTGNYLNNVLAMAEARAAGDDDAIMLDYRGRVTEATTSNVFTVSKGRLLTPPLSVGILEGVTRGLIMRVARERGLEVEEVDLLPEDLYRADEVFLTGTLKEVVSVVRVNGLPVGGGDPGPVTRRISKWFEELTRRAT
ncbi:MAG: aminotransferase class IV [Deltaproteobacteria bacterium]|nr:aminotransferase class IV [Deltaproteobacteria bacterium]